MSTHCSICGEHRRRFSPEKRGNLTYKQKFEFKKFRLCPKCYNRVRSRAYLKWMGGNEDEVIELFKESYNELKEVVGK